MNRLGVFAAMVVEFAASLLLVLASALLFSSFPLMMSVTFLLGVTVQGAQAGLNALAAMYYPTIIRSTGVGWALGVGRIGSIVGPLIGGVMLSLQWSPQRIFTAGAVPALCAVAAVVVSRQILGGASPYRAAGEAATSEAEEAPAAGR